MSEPVFDIRGLSLAYGQRVAVQDVDLQIRPHETTVLIGSNGCGKSTLLKGLSRQLAPSSGTISFQGTELSQVRSKGYARDVALLPQTPVVPEGLTVAELVARGRHPHRQWWGSPAAGDDEAVARALSMLSLQDFADRRVDELSGGQRQRAWIALVLAQDTPVVLLDEPTANLDPAATLAIEQLIQAAHRAGTTILMVTHDRDQARRLARRVLLLCRGRVVEDASAEAFFTAPQSDEARAFLAGRLVF